MEKKIENNREKNKWFEKKLSQIQKIRKTIWTFFKKLTRNKFGRKNDKMIWERMKKSILKKN